MKKAIQFLEITLGLVVLFSFTSTNITPKALEHGETFALKLENNSIQYVLREHGETF
ncbi:hypothetical protein U2I54_15880 [Bacillus pseudomycoides]|uniref:Uncharacterized protein n=1 Tax=Bacillus bingmayongensis TaxID=1150157 RepID=A0ABU5JYN2_9BACI|nr:hypothetical protein [Bacillus pseudomycoides]